MAEGSIYIFSDMGTKNLLSMIENGLTIVGSGRKIRSCTQVEDSLGLTQSLRQIDCREHSPLILYHFWNKELTHLLLEFCNHHRFSCFNPILPLKNALEKASEPFSPPLPMSLLEEEKKSSFPEREERFQAIEFARRFDDGKDPSGILQADVCIIGISRTQKTPLSMILANRNYRVVNVPLVPEMQLPNQLFQIHPARIFGLTVACDSLVKMRKERLKALGLSETSKYASQERILEELSYAREVMKKIGCPIIDVSHRAVEETAEIILQMLKEKF